MFYVVTATRGVTAMVSSLGTDAHAIEWIRRRRLVGADHFTVIDEQLRLVGEVDLPNLAQRE